MATEPAHREETLPAKDLERIRRARSNPRPTQFDYLHLRVLREDVARELAALPQGIEVLDLFCGTRPYEGLLPAGSRCTGLDIDRRYGAADVVSKEFLPFGDASFDLVACFEAFHYLPDPEAAASEIARVLRPGGRALISVPLVWEYDSTQLEHRFTAPELEALFAGWDDVRLTENGGRGVAWATQTAHLLHLARERIGRRLGPAAPLLAPFFALAYLLVNGVGAIAEKASGGGPMRLPMNLTISARRR
jgi:SAM-dependent methyltransferase